jgi:hypothetical protein
VQMKRMYGLQADESSTFVTILPAYRTAPESENHFRRQLNDPRPSPTEARIRLGLEF